MDNCDLAERLWSMWPIATINRTRAEIVACSITPYGDETRLDSIYVVFPKMVMVERNRHRAFSLSDRSSRAVPPEKLIAEIRSGEGLAMPAKFRRRSKGMGGGEDLTGDELIAAQLRWIEDALCAADAAERAMEYEAKETTNRRIDPYIYAHSLMTATRDGWLNFFGLRLDEGADPTIQVLAQQCLEVYRSTEPTLLRPGQWHLPFVTSDEVFQESMCLEVARELSAARCAHLSFKDLETGQLMTVDRALSIAARLRDSSPLHASPFEHQACVDEIADYEISTTVPTKEQRDNRELPMSILLHLKHVSERGNFAPGWRQARKMIPGEAVAPLPEGWML